MNTIAIQGQQEPKKQLPQLIKQSTTYKLFVPKKVEEKIRYLIRKFPHTEWSGILFYSHTGNFENGDLEIHCEDIYPMDLGSGTFTDFKMDASVVAYIADNIDLFGCEMGLVHSHHTMGAFFSGTDVNTLRSEGDDTNCFVSLIVDTKGTYQAAITRKVKEKKELTTYYFGKSYEFFGEGEVKTEPPYQAPDVHQKMVEEERIEYFMLDVQREETTNPLDYLDARFEEIESKKRTQEPTALANSTSIRIYDPKKGDTKLVPAPKWGTDGSLDKDTEDKEFYDWIHESRKQEAKEPTLFSSDEMGKINIDNWNPDPTIIHYLVCQLLTSSLIVNKDIDLKQWLVKHMVKKYDEIFGNPDSLEFENWATAISDFALNHYNDENIPEEYYEDIDAFMGRIAEAILDELATYPTNGYIKGYSDVLTRYVM